MQPRLTPVARLAVTIASPLELGDTGGGTREIIAITGGRVEGPLLTGIVLPGGADWALTRADGVAEIWARYTIRTSDGSLIMVTNPGLAHQQQDGTWQGHTAPVFEVAAPAYLWLCRSVFVGSLLARASGDLVELEWWRLD